MKGSVVLRMLLATTVVAEPAALLESVTLGQALPEWASTHPLAISSERRSSPARTPSDLGHARLERLGLARDRRRPDAELPNKDRGLRSAATRVAAGESGSLELRNVVFSATNIGSAQPFPFKLTMELAVSGAEPSHIDAKGKLDLSGPALIATAVIDRLPADAMARAAAAQAGKQPPAAAKASMVGPVDTGDLRVSVALKIDKLEAGGLTCSDARAMATLEPGRASLSGIHAALAGGQLEGILSLDLGSAGLPYQGSLSLRKARLEQLIAPFRNQGWGEMTGQLDLQADFEARGASSAQILPSLQAEMQIQLTDGRLTDPAFLKTISKATGIEAFHDLEVTDSGGRVSISGGRLRTEQLLLGGPEAKLLAVGDAAFAGDLDLEVWLGFSPRAHPGWFSKATLLPHIRGKDGWTSIPVLLGGTLEEPVTTIPKRAIAERALTLLPEATARLLMGGLGTTRIILEGGVDTTGKILKGGAGAAKTILKGGAGGLRSILSGVDGVLGGKSSSGNSKPKATKPAR